MVQLAVLLTGSPTIAEDVVQDAFSTVIERWDKLDNPGGYLRTVVVNNCHQEHRRAKVRARSEPPSWVLPLDTPHEIVELRDAVARLSRRQRTIVVLRYFLDLPDDEIANMLGCKTSTVRSNAHRAIAHLRRELSS